MKEIVRFIIFVVGLTMGCSCKDNASPVVKLFKAHMEKEISLEGFKEVYSEQDTLSYGDFRKRHPFLFVSYGRSPYVADMQRPFVIQGDVWCIIKVLKKRLRVGCA